MPATDADEEATEATTEAVAVPAHRDARLVAAVAVAAAFAAVAVVMAVIALSERGRSDNGTDRTEISTTAARVAEAITAVDGSGNSTLASTVEQLTTASVVEQYKEISSAISGQLGTLKLTSIRGTVKEVYVGNVDSAESRVIVRLDLVFVGDNTRVVPDQYLDMTLAKLDGVWKVDNVEVLNVKLENPPPSTGSTGTTATTAPAPSSS